MPDDPQDEEWCTATVRNASLASAPFGRIADKRGRVLYYGGVMRDGVRYRTARAVLDGAAQRR